MANAEDRGVESPEADLARLRDEVSRYTHALANVLGAILNYSAFLAEDLERMADAADASTYLAHLDRAAHRAVELVSALDGANR